MTSSSASAGQRGLLRAAAVAELVGDVGGRAASSPVIARRKTDNGSGLGTVRWVVERTFAWLHFFRRLRIRWERRPELHETFMHLGCAMICQRYLRRLATPADAANMTA